MKLRQLVQNALDLDAELPNVEVRGVAQDSRQVAPGFVFVARRGRTYDGHAFVAEAIEQGAVAVVGEGAQGNWSVPYIRVEDDKIALAKLAAAFHGHPSRSLTIVGVTGTDGKTTTATMLHHLLMAKHGTALITTVGAKIGEESMKLPGHFTTPEATEIQALLARALHSGCTHAVLESSSQGLAQRRLDEISYDLAVFTNLNPEHLDYHGTFAKYREAKAELFRRAPKSILNADDESAAYFADLSKEVITYGIDADEAEWRAHGVREEQGRLEWTLRVKARDYPIPEASFAARAQAVLPMIGVHNVHNALAALAAAHALGLDLELLLDRLATFPGVPGRMQVVASEPFTVVVDFAHTAPALGKVLEALRRQARGKLVVVTGATGERDPGKRESLGYTAARLADLAIFTEEDPRSEDVGKIIAALARGARNAGGKEGEDYVIVPDRREAIRRAIQLAEEGDAVLLAGKGHEDVLYRREPIPWNEVEEARRALEEIE
jgi:UDP-N-acetylmuramoyl-L-alanyl-D-glutamate--2,6-diaminopimelate ligase